MVGILTPGATLIAICKDAPENCITTEEGKRLAMDRYAQSPDPQCREDLIPKMYDRGKIDKRHVAFLPVIPPAEEPSLEARLHGAVKVITPIAVRTAAAAMALAGIVASDVGCVVAVSSTVLHEPGVSAAIVEQLGLPRETERTPVSFAGCAAGVAGLRVAEDFVRGKQGKCAMLVAFEVSSAHARGIVRSVSGEVIHSIFADGCAVGIVTANGSRFEKKVRDMGRPVIKLLGRRSELMENAADGIVLEATSAAIDCMLSKELPKYLVRGIQGYVERLMGEIGKTREEVEYWAVHPGGRRIVESVQIGCKLEDEVLKESYEVLREQGNMLSVAVLFVLRLLMQRYEREQKECKDWIGQKLGVGFSFAPGVSTEGFVFAVTADRK